MQLPKAVPQELYALLHATPRAALGFSGGVDSSYLLYAARASGVEVRGYYADSQFQPRFELEDARRVARETGAELTVLPLDVLSNAAVRANPEARCYHCKRAIFKVLLEKAGADGYTVLMDGSNASDDAGDRPGMRALEEMKIRSPLREAGLTKARIRELSREAGLFTWDKAAYACLATRIPAGTPITKEMLEKVENAENALFSMGLTDFRARVLGNAVKLQMPAAQIGVAVARREEILGVLSAWFEDVLLDMRGR